MQLIYFISKFSFQSIVNVILSKILVIFCKRDAHKRKPFSAIAYAGIYDWNKDQSQAQQVAFTEADVTLYPDNQNPGQ